MHISLLDTVVPDSNEKHSNAILVGTNGIIVVALLAAFLSLISAAIIKKVFCTSHTLAGALHTEEKAVTKTVNGV